MQKTILPIVLLMILWHSGNAIAGGQKGMVIDIRVDDTNGLAYIKLDATNTLAACATILNGMWTVNTHTETGKAMLSIILTAYSTGKPIYISGYGRCTLRSDMEDVAIVQLANQL